MAPLKQHPELQRGRRGMAERTVTGWCCGGLGEDPFRPKAAAGIMVASKKWNYVPLRFGFPLLLRNGETFQTVRADLPAPPSPVFPEAEYDAATDNPTAAEACELPRRQCLHLAVWPIPGLSALHGSRAS
jgi:hypothetical protein